MKEQDLIRKAIAPSLPHPEQVRQNILHGQAPKARRKSLRTYFPAAACIALLLTAAVIFTQWNPLSNHFAAAVPDPTDQTEQGQTPAPATRKETTPALAPEIHFNELGEVLSAHRLYYDPKETFEKHLTFTQLVDYLGRDIRPTFLPKGLQAEDVKNLTFTMICNNDGSVLYDSVGFYYQEKPGNPDYDPLERKMIISVSKMRLMGDCIYVWPDDMQKTYLNGHTVQLGKRKMPYGPYTVVADGPNTPAGYYDLFVAQFQFAGLYYEVVADNLTQAEFIETLASMLPA